MQKNHICYYYYICQKIYTTQNDQGMLANEICVCVCVRVCVDTKIEIQTCPRVNK